jgi:hypothetical protein
VPVAAVALGVADAPGDLLGVGDGDPDAEAEGEAEALLVNDTWFDMPGVPEGSEDGAADDETAGRIVVAAPSTGPGPGPSSAMNPPVATAAIATAATAPAISERRFFLRDADSRAAARVAARPCAVRRPGRRGAAADPAGPGSQTALMAGP